MTVRLMSEHVGPVLRLDTAGAAMLRPALARRNAVVASEGILNEWMWSGSGGLRAVGALESYHLEDHGCI